MLTQIIYHKICFEISKHVCLPNTIRIYINNWSRMQSNKKGKINFILYNRKLHTPYTLKDLVEINLVKYCYVVFFCFQFNFFLFLTMKNTKRHKKIKLKLNKKQKQYGSWYHQSLAYRKCIADMNTRVAVKIYDYFRILFEVVRIYSNTHIYIIGHYNPSVRNSA